MVPGQISRRLSIAGLVAALSVGCVSCNVTVQQKVVNDVKDRSQSIDDDLRAELRKHRTPTQALTDGVSALRNGGQVATMLVDQDITRSGKVRYDIVLKSNRFAGGGWSYKQKTARLCMRLEGTIGPGSTVTESNISCPPEPEYRADIDVKLDD